MDIKNRIKAVVEHYGINVTQFEKKASLSNGYVNNIRNSISEQKLEQISKAFPEINRVWLKMGEGDMLNGLGQQNQNRTNLIKQNIPMYSSITTASEVEVYNDFDNEGPAFFVSIPQFNDCKFGKLIYGHSMYPTITSGSYIFCKPVTNKARFIPGEIYYVEYDNFGVCKRVQKGLSNDEVLLVSDNDEVRADGTRRYESFILKIDEIRNMYLVKGFLNQNHN